jgi:hypothetical protein
MSKRSPAKRDLHRVFMESRQTHLQGAIAHNAVNITPAHSCSPGASCKLSEVVDHESMRMLAFLKSASTTGLCTIKRMKNERMRCRKKICPTMHPYWRLAASDNVAAITATSCHRP